MSAFMRSDAQPADSPTEGESSGSRTPPSPFRLPPSGEDHAKAAAPLSAAVRVVSGLTLLSRLAGLARYIVTARMFGLGALGSGFQAAYSLPNLFRRLFGEGALSAAF